MTIIVKEFRNRVDKLHHACWYQEMYQCVECSYRDDVTLLLDEIERLKRGDFTPEEFQNLCHNLHEKEGCTRKDFEEGCREYQRRLFGG